MMLISFDCWSIVVHDSIQRIIKVIRHWNGHEKQVREMYLLIWKVKVRKNLILQHLRQRRRQMDHHRNVRVKNDEVWTNPLRLHRLFQMKTIELNHCPAKFLAHLHSLSSSSSSSSSFHLSSPFFSLMACLYIYCFFIRQASIEKKCLVFQSLTSSRVASELCNPWVSNVTRLSADKLCCFGSELIWPDDVWLSNAVNRSAKGT